MKVTLNKYSETDIIRMVEFSIDNIYVEFGGHVYQQTVGIPMGTNCAPLVAYLFLYSYESFNLTFRHKDDVLSLNNVP